MQHAFVKMLKKLTIDNTNNHPFEGFEIVSKLFSTRVKQMMSCEESFQINAIEDLKSMMARKKSFQTNALEDPKMF